MVIPHQSGCGGAGPSRSSNPKAETVKRINTSFPHWFCGHFKLFNDDVTRLPFDQNGLVAICAPGPVLLTNAQEDQWANPGGQFDVLRAAAPAYELYDVEKPVVAPAMPAEGKLSAERLGLGWRWPGAMRESGLRRTWAWSPQRPLGRPGCWRSCALGSRAPAGLEALSYWHACLRPARLYRSGVPRRCSMSAS